MRRGSVKRLWRTTGYLVEPKTDRDLMTTIGAVGTHSTGQRFAWRGLSSADYVLSSSLHRSLGEDRDENAVKAAEDSVIQGAHRWRLGVTKLGVIDDLQLLADLQHFGVSTRLIDVTSDPMTALWFACQPPSRENAIKDGLLVAINTSGWEEVIAMTQTDGTYGTAGAFHGTSRKKALEHERPRVIRVAEANPRLAAQSGYFLFGRVPASPMYVFPSLNIDFANRTDGLDLVSPRTQGRPEKLPFVVILVPAELKKRLLSHLDATYDKSARTLFPDFSGYREFGVAAGSREPSKAV